MKTPYGFYTEHCLTEDVFVDSLMTGDGHTVFCGSKCQDAIVAIGIGYDENNDSQTFTETTTKCLGIKWQIKFDSVDSIDAMINILEGLKVALIEGTNK